MIEYTVHTVTNISECMELLDKLLSAIKANYCIIEKAKRIEVVDINCSDFCWSINTKHADNCRVRQWAMTVNVASE